MYSFKSCLVIDNMDDSVTPRYAFDEFDAPLITDLTASFEFDGGYIYKNDYVFDIEMCSELNDDGLVEKIFADMIMIAGSENTYNTMDEVRYHYFINDYYLMFSYISRNVCERIDTFTYALNEYLDDEYVYFIPNSEYLGVVAQKSTTRGMSIIYPKLVCRIPRNAGH